MNTNQKGNKAELECEQILKREGLITNRAIRTNKKYYANGKWHFMSYQNDIFGKFDIIGKSRAMTRWVQVKTNKSHVSEFKRSVKEYLDFFNQNDSVECWLKVARKGWIIHYWDLYDKDWKKRFIDLDGLLCDKF